MRQHFRRATGAILAGLLLAAPVSAADDDLQELTWLAGCWKSASAEAGSGEHWTTPTGGTMLGVSRTISGGKTVAFEFMQIRQMDDGRLVFIAQPSGSASTVFPVKSLTGSKVVFENAKHDFPQRIIYARTTEGELLARVEGVLDGQERGVDFAMMRVDCTAYFAVHE